jgi:hypothetical protein
MVLGELADEILPKHVCVQRARGLVHRLDTPIRIVPGFFGVAWLVPSAVEPKSASSRLAPLATDGTSSMLLDAAV